MDIMVDSLSAWHGIVLEPIDLVMDEEDVMVDYKGKRNTKSNKVSREIEYVSY
jgi:hypothetical protein